MSTTLNAAVRARLRWRRTAIAVAMGAGALVLPIAPTTAQAAPAAPAAPATDDVWTVIDLPQARTGSRAGSVAAPQIAIHTTAQVALGLDADAMAAQLASAPMEAAGQTGSAAGRAAGASATTIELPAPDGTMDRFAIVESPIMSPELAAEHPEITTYAGVGIDDPAATIRLDQTPAGFHAQVLSPNGAWYIDPYFHLDDSVYVSYFREDLLDSHGDEVHPDVPTSTTSTEDLARPASSVGPGRGDLRRTFRLAVATTGEYAAFHGGTIPSAQAAITTVVNRVNGIYEQELAVRLELVSTVVFTDANTDPYTTGDIPGMLSSNQAVLDIGVGSANYDVGHLFAADWVGFGELASVGVPGKKGQGVSGIANPVGDAFAVDYVSSGIGRQLGANNTFSYCFGDSDSPSAIEPGSGSTIMGYAGTCGPDNLALNSKPYFHAKSYDEIQTYLDTIPSVGTKTATFNWPPQVNSLGGSTFTIPPRTPFQLTATGIDRDAADVLTYTWEQYDVGTPRALAVQPKPDGPLFGSTPPSTERVRSFPNALSVYLGNTNAATGTCPAPPGGLACLAEFLPTTARTMNFRATVRDNHVGGGGVNTTDVVVNVAGTTPFRVTSFATPTALQAGSTQIVTWDTAGTETGAVNTPTVDILVSLDLREPFLLVSNTPNDGSEAITVPAWNSSSVRFTVQAHRNIFYDVSDAEVSIVGAASTSLQPPFDLVATPISNSRVQLAWTTNVGSMDQFRIEMKTLDAPQFTVVSESTGAIPSGSGFLSVVRSLVIGETYVFRVSGKTASEGFSMPSGASLPVTMTGLATAPGAPGRPVGVAGNGRVALSWEAADNNGSPILDYLIDYRKVGAAEFTEFVDGVSVATSATVTGLTNGTAYEFRVFAQSKEGFGPDSVISSPVAPSADILAPPVPPASGTGFVALTPTRVFDTRASEPQAAVTVVKQVYGGPDNILRVKVTGAAGVPLTGVGAVSLNLTAVTPSGPGYVTAFPCGQRPLVASLTYVAGQIVPNAVIAPVSDNGEVCFFSLADTHLIADVNGWFPKGGGFTAIQPGRLYDTREGDQPRKYGGRDNVLRVKVTGAAGLPAGDLAAVSLNVTAAFPEDSGFVTVFPCGERPLAANLNYLSGQIVANAVIAPVSDAGEVCFFSLAPTHLVIDVNGWFVKGSSFHSLSPVRVFDTRPGETPGAVTVEQRVYGGANILTVKFAGAAGVPATGANAVSLNVTAVLPDGPGFVTVFPCGDRPLAANLNYVAGQIVPNAVVAPLSNEGEVCFYSLANTHLIADVNGWFGEKPMQLS